MGGFICPKSKNTRKKCLILPLEVFPLPTKLMFHVKQNTTRVLVKKLILPLLHKSTVKCYDTYVTNLTMKKVTLPIKKCFPVALPPFLSQVFVVHARCTTFYLFFEFPNSYSKDITARLLLNHILRYFGTDSCNWYFTDENTRAKYQTAFARSLFLNNWKLIDDYHGYIRIANVGERGVEQAEHTRSENVGQVEGIGIVLLLRQAK